MTFIKFNGVLQKIVNLEQNTEIVTFLTTYLNIPHYKAKILAERIISKYNPDTVRMLTENNTRSNHESKDALKLSPKVNIYSIDSLSGKEFEQFLQWLFEQLGYEVQPGKYVADSGVDLVAIKGEEKIAVQAKRFQRSTKVSNSVILKTQGGMGVYGCNKSIVVTSSYFTHQAVSDAEKLNLELWDRDTLSAKIDEINNRQEKEEIKPKFPPYTGSLLQSLIRLEETKEFIIERKENGKFDIHLPGIKYPLLSFQTRLNQVTKCVYRIKNNQPVGEYEGFALIKSDAHYRYGPAGERAYQQIIQYLEQYIN